jgi:hypothetical protein
MPIALAMMHLRHFDLQHAVRHGCLNLRRVNPIRQLEDAIKDAVATLREPIILVFLVLLFPLDLLLAANGQDIVFDRDIDVFALEARQLRRDLDFLVALGDVHARQQISLAADAMREVVEETIDLALQRAE